LVGEKFTFFRDTGYALALSATEQLCREIKKLQI